MLKRRGASTDPCGTPSLRSRNLLLFAISGGKGKTTITNHRHDHVDHVSVRQQSQQLAGEVAVPYCVELILKEGICTRRNSKENDKVHEKNNLQRIIQIT